MCRLITCFSLIFFLMCFCPPSSFSETAPQSLADLFQSGSIKLTRDLVISEKEFPEEIYFQNPRGIVVHTDGRIYVSDSAAHNIKMISSAGKLLQVIGQEGQGPGDFNSPSYIAISRDRLVVWESMNRRFSILDMDGKFIKSVKIDNEMGRPIKMKALPDDRLVVMTETLNDVDKKSAQVFRLFLLSSDLEVVKTLSSQKLRRVNLITDPMRIYVPQPYTPNIHWDITSDGLIALGCSDLCDIEVHDPDKGMLFSFSHEYIPVKITDADKHNHFSIFTINIMRGNAKETKQGAPDYIKDNTDFPKYKPAFKEIVTDDEGNIWVKPYHEDRDLEDYLFDVFDKKGQFIKRIQVIGETAFPSFWTSKINKKIFWEIEKVDEEFFRIVRNEISE
ncbi:6-bladed beta-propeller [Acidobacteriota bacterium]